MQNIFSIKATLQLRTDIFIQTDVDSIHDNAFDNDAIVSGFLRNMMRWDKLTLVVVEQGKMQNINKQVNQLDKEFLCK